VGEGGGLSVQSACKLRRRADGFGFAEAWDIDPAMAADRIYDAAIDRGGW
jgi:hypothetical protein